MFVKKQTITNNIKGTTMRHNTHTTESPHFTLKLGFETANKKEPKLQVTDKHEEFGITEWEIILNKAVTVHDSIINGKIKKMETEVDNGMRVLDPKNTPQGSDYWVS